MGANMCKGGAQLEKQRAVCYNGQNSDRESGYE